MLANIHMFKDKRNIVIILLLLIIAALVSMEFINQHRKNQRTTLATKTILSLQAAKTKQEAKAIIGQASVLLSSNRPISVVPSFASAQYIHDHTTVVDRSKVCQQITWEIVGAIMNGDFDLYSYSSSEYEDSCVMMAD